MPILILEMCSFANTVQHFMVANCLPMFNNCIEELCTAWRVATQALLVLISLRMEP